MRIYSAGEAIGPAWEHTKALLFADRRFGRLLKLCLVAFGAQLGSGFNGNYRGSGQHLPAAMLTLLLVFALFGLLFSIAALYVGSRLQFVLFDIVLLRDDRVAPAWRRHSRHTWRWVGVRLVMGLALLLLLSPLLIPIGIAFFHLMQSNAFRGGTPAGFNFAMVRTMLVLIAEALSVFALFLMAFRLFSTLALPGLALEDLSFGAVFARAWLLFQTDPPAMLLYAVIQPLLLLVLSFVVLFCWMLLLALPAVPVVLMLVRLWHAGHAGLGGMFWLGTIGGLGAVALLLWAVLTYLLLVGNLLTFVQAYSLYFVGGRYPLVGQYLEPEAAPQLGFRDPPDIA